MIGLLLACVLVAALVAAGARRMARARGRRAAIRAPGASAELAIPIRGWDDMAPHVARVRCERCGVRLAERGEGSRQLAGRRLRVVRLECPECDRTVQLWFDTGALRH